MSLAFSFTDRLTGDQSLMVPRNAIGLLLAQLGQIDYVSDVEPASPQLDEVWLDQSGGIDVAWPIKVWTATGWRVDDKFIDVKLTRRLAGKLDKTGGTLTGTLNGGKLALTGELLAAFAELEGAIVLGKGAVTGGGGAAILGNDGDDVAFRPSKLDGTYRTGRDLRFDQEASQWEVQGPLKVTGVAEVNGKVFRAPVETVETRGSMLTNVNVKPGQVYRIAARGSAGDDWGGEFVLDEASTDPVDNARILQPAAPAIGRLKRLWSQGIFEARWFDNNQPNWTTDLQKAIDEASAWNQAFLETEGIKYGGAVLRLGQGVKRINGPLEVTGHGCSIVGGGHGASVIELLDQTQDGFVISRQNPFDEDDERERIGIVNLEGFSIIMKNANVNNNFSNNGIVLDRAGGCHLHNMHIINLFRCLDLRGVERGCMFDKLTLVASNSTGVTAFKEGSGQVRLTRREVDGATSLGRLDATDSKFYVPNTMTHWSNIQMHGVGYGALTNFKVESSDGVAWTGGHFGFARQAQISVEAIQTNLPIINLFFTGAFNDDAQNLGYVETSPGVFEQDNIWTKRCVEIIDPNNLGTAITDVTFIGGECNGADEAGYYFDAPGLDRVTIAKQQITFGQLHGIDIRRGQNINILGNQFRGMNGSNTTGASIRAGNSEGDVIVIGNTFQGAYRHLFLDTNAARVFFIANVLRGASDVDIIDQSTSMAHVIEGNNTDMALTCVAAGGLQPPNAADGGKKCTVQNDTGAVVVVSNIDIGAAGGKHGRDNSRYDFIARGNGDVRFVHGTNFILAGGANLQLKPGDQLSIWRDPVDDVWREDRRVVV